MKTGRPGFDQSTPVRVIPAKAGIQSRARCPQPLECDGGFIIVAVLWFVTALATLTTVYTLYLHSVAPNVVVGTDRLKAHALEVAGVELAAARLMTPSPPPAGRFSIRVGDADVAVSFRAEAGFVDINFAPRETLARLFAEFGAKDDAALSLADRIIGWRTAAKPGTEQKEAALYGAAKRPDVPRLGPFQHVDELSLVLGAPPDLLERVLPFLTVFSGRADVNVAAAPPEVAAIVPKPSPEPTPGADAPANAPDAAATPTPAPTPDATHTGAVNRVTVEVRLGPKLRFRADAVILQFADDSEPYRLLSWRE